MVKRSNVLLIMTDQHRADALGCYGNPVIETPNLDWIASRGTVFQNSYSPSPSCIPARACLISGMDQWNAGVLGMGIGQLGIGNAGFEYTLPGELAKNGYHTQGIGKMHFSPQRDLNGFHNTELDEEGRQEDPGFVSDYRRWFEKYRTGDYGPTDHGIGWNSWMARPFHAPEFLHPTNWTVNESIRFLEKRDPTRPFFLMTSFARPHSPYDALPYYFDLYMDKDIPKPYNGQWASIHDVPQDAALPDAWRGRRSEEEIKRSRAGYYGLITHIDHQIGRLLEYMRKKKLLENTIIIFTSDHGDMLGDHHLWRKTYAYEGSARIPMIVCLPADMREQVKRGKVYEPVSLQDVMPTILDAAGIEQPDAVTGMSMLPLIRNEQCGWREYIHGEHCTCYSEEMEMHYLTDGSFKYIWYSRTNKEQLFNIEKDRSECVDLSGSMEYCNELVRWRKRLADDLKTRNAGLTDGKGLVCQKGRPFILPPMNTVRKNKLESMGFDWFGK